MLNASVQAQLENIMDDYAKYVDKTTEDVIETVATETVNTLKNTSPKRTGRYAGSWKKKKGETKLSRTVYNAKHYQLTHLLNNGHVVRNKYGTYGRVNGDNHIGAAEEQAAQSLIARLERDL